MKTTKIFLLWLLALAPICRLGADGSATEDAEAARLLTGARVLDAEGTRLLDVAVLVEDGKITAVGPADELAVPAGVRRLDLSGLTLIPGLIDLHTHLLLHPYDEAS